MIIALMMLQIVLVILEYPANIIAVSPSLVFLPSMLIGFLFVFGWTFGWAAGRPITVKMDQWRFTEMFEVTSPKRRTVRR